MTTASKTQAHLSERTYTPLAIAAFLLGTAILSGAAEPNEMLAALRQQSVTLRLEGKEKPSALLVPAEFKAASSVSEIAIRDSQLATMNSNPERSTRYSDWMVYDWNAPKNMPWLMVASMGGLIRRQGMISEAEWNRFKAEALCLQGQDLANRIADAERRIRNGAKLNYEIMKREITEIFVSDSVIQIASLL